MLILIEILQFQVKIIHREVSKSMLLKILTIYGFSPIYFVHDCLRIFFVRNLPHFYQICRISTNYAYFCVFLRKHCFFGEMVENRPKVC